MASLLLRYGSWGGLVAWGYLVDYVCLVAAVWMPAAGRRRCRVSDTGHGGVLVLVVLCVSSVPGVLVLVVLCVGFLTVAAVAMGAGCR